MMNHDDELLQDMRITLAKLEEALATLRQDQPNMHPDQYAFMTDPILDMMNDLRQKIDRHTAAAEAKSA